MKKAPIEHLGFNDFWLCLIGIPIVGFSTPLLFYGASLSEGFIAFIPEFIIGIYYSFCYWLGSRQILIEVRKKHPNFEDARKRIIIQTLLVIAYATLVSLISELSFGFIFDSVRKSIDQHGISGIFAPYFIIFFMNAIYESIYFYHQLKISIEEKEAVKHAQLHSELEGLRNQVNPHFLFNSLNTLMNIVAEDQKLAISFLKKLSKVYRYVLDNRRAQLIPLSEEMDFIHSYIFLQKERFQSNLNFEIELEEKYLNYEIIPLALQILFENAIKHNVVSSRHPLTIRVFVQDEKLVVENNLQRKNIVMPGTKVGLENVKTRYRLFTDVTVDIIETEDIFSVAVPLLG